MHMLAYSSIIMEAIIPSDHQTRYPTYQPVSTTTSRTRSTTRHVTAVLLVVLAASYPHSHDHHQQAITCIPQLEIKLVAFVLVLLRQELMIVSP